MTRHVVADPGATATARPTIRATRARHAVVRPGLNAAKPAWGRG